MIRNVSCCNGVFCSSVSTQPRFAAAFKFVILTGTYLDLLPRYAGHSRVNFANATKLDRKSRLAQWRDLRIGLIEKRNRRRFIHCTFAVPESKTAGPSLTLRFSRDDKFEAGGKPRHQRRWMDRVEKTRSYCVKRSRTTPWRGTVAV
jgi:hypothetical protein